MDTWNMETWKHERMEAQKHVTILRSKCAEEVKKNGLLEICPSPGSLDDIGGLELLKEWLRQRKEAFGQRAADYRLPSPKGLLIIGIPGTGKSLTAKATASVLQRHESAKDPLSR